jgi:hypothetical protein
MKKIIILYLVLSYSNSFSQVGLKAIYVRPTGDLGMTMNATVSGELIFKPFDRKFNEGSKWQPRVSIGFIKFSPRLASFPVVGIISSQSTTISPGTMSYSKYNAMYLSGGIDYMIKLGSSFFLYPGLDINFGGINQSYQSHYPLIADEGYTGGSVYVGIRARVGAEYRIKKIAFFMEATRNMNIIINESFMNYNDYGIGIRYSFKD